MLVTFEGIEGCGKSTQARMLYDWLSDSGKSVLLTREPGSTPLGEKLRSILLNRDSGDISILSELFLYLADRSEHVQKVVRPALDQNKMVIIDRYVDSTLVYQGHGRGFESSFLQDLNYRASCGVWPDLTFVLDLPPEEGLKRANARNEQNGMDTQEGRFEAEKLEFHQSIRKGYLDLGRQESERIRVLDALKPVESIFEQVKEHVQNKLASQ